MGLVIVWAIWNTVRQDNGVALVEKSFNWPENNRAQQRSPDGPCFIAAAR